MHITLVEATPIGPFSYRWPEGEPEQYTHGWDILAQVDGRPVRLRHAIGTRPAYGRARVRSVTWLAGAPMVEGVEADDYPESRALLSLLRHPDKRHIRDRAELPAGYEGFRVVGHRAEVDARHSPNSLALKIVEDDLEAWVIHGLIRAASYAQARPAAAPARAPVAPVPVADTRPLPLKAIDPSTRTAVVRSLLAHGAHLASVVGKGPPAFTTDPAADALVAEDPFAFLLGVIFDQGVPAERAWLAPYHLRARLGHLDPARIAESPEAVREAVNRRAPVALHRYVNTVPEWVVSAARRVLEHYGGDAARIWDDAPSASRLQRRLRDFPGIGQKKAAMAVEILARDLGKEIRNLDESDVAYDVHIRRVFLRTGLAERDELAHMIDAARALHPERPGALDYPAWDVGRRWCHPGIPDCPRCTLRDVCPKDVDRAANVFGA